MSYCRLCLVVSLSSIPGIPHPMRGFPWNFVTVVGTKKSIMLLLDGGKTLICAFDTIPDGCNC